MKYDFDIITIGMGPAGMAVSAMGTEMGLKVCGIEKNKIGGECMNYGCIPSKSLLRMAKTRHVFEKLSEMELSQVEKPKVLNPFKRVDDYLKFINEQKTMTMFKKVELILRKGAASFIDNHTVCVDNKKITAKNIYICTGTSPSIPPVSGIKDGPYLTNENIFKLDSIPKSLIVIGGGAIGCELAQAFARLGSKVSVVHMDEYLIPAGNSDPGKLVAEQFKKEGIEVFNNRIIKRVNYDNNNVSLITDSNEQINGEKLLVAAGRAMDFSSLALEKAGVAYKRQGIIVDKYLRTTTPNIYAVGDCNGQFLLSHSAMHQGMIALINSMLPWPFKRDFKAFVVPWTVFIEPEVSHVGMTEKQLEDSNIKYEIIEVKYEDYGAAIAEGIGVGYIKAYITKFGKILGVGIVGKRSGEMINEWGLAIQKGIRIHDIMMLQHSFPSMSFLNKRVGESWMMKKMESKFIKKLCRLAF